MDGVPQFWEDRIAYKLGTAQFVGKGEHGNIFDQKQLEKLCLHDRFFQEQAFEWKWVQLRRNKQIQYLDIPKNLAIFQ